MVALNDILYSFTKSLVVALPNFFGGLLILIAGIVLGNLLKRLVQSLFTFIRLDKIALTAKAFPKSEVKIWGEIVAEIVRWAVLLLFLIPALEIWGLSGATTVINQFLFYLPNVIVAVVIAFVGVLSSNLAANVVRRSVKSLGTTSANTLAALTHGIIIFFTALVVLNQLGVAQDLIRILFTGIVFMITIAGGLAFGLGGKDLARDILLEFRKKILKTDE